MLSGKSKGRLRFIAFILVLGYTSCYDRTKQMSMEYQYNKLVTLGTKDSLQVKFISNLKKLADSTLKMLQLDDLLLTQGWRRFTWSNTAANGTQLPAYLPEESLQISGRLIDNVGRPIPNSKVSTFAVINNLPLLKDTVTDHNGRFIVKGLDFEGDARCAVQAKDVKNIYKIRILPDTAILPVVAHLQQDKSYIVQTYVAASKQRFDELNDYIGKRKGIQLKEVVIKEKKIAYSLSVAGRNFSDKVISNDNIKRPHLPPECDRNGSTLYSL